MTIPENTSDTHNHSDNRQWQLTALTEALGDLKLTIEDKLSVGRGKDNDVVLGSKQVSRQHAQLSVRDNDLLIQDLGSSNGTMVNDVKLVPNQATTLTLNDVVTFAAFSFQVGQTDIVQSGLGSSQPVDTDPKSNLADKPDSLETADARKHAKENQEAVDKVGLEDMSNAELEQKLEAELEEPIPYGDPTENQLHTDSTEHFEELAAEADPEVHKAKQAAASQLSATTNIREDVQKVSADSSKPVNSKPVKEHQTTEKPTQSFNTVGEQTDHKVAHITKTQLPEKNVNAGKGKGFLWLILILVALGIALWLYNGGM